MTDDALKWQPAHHRYVEAATSWDTASASFRIAPLHMSDKAHAPHGLVGKPLT
jgi:hypothetical protein